MRIHLQKSLRQRPSSSSNRKEVPHRVSQIPLDALCLPRAGKRKALSALWDEPYEETSAVQHLEGRRLRRPPTMVHQPTILPVSHFPMLGQTHRRSVLCSSQVPDPFGVSHSLSSRSVMSQARRSFNSSLHAFLFLRSAAKPLFSLSRKSFARRPGILACSLVGGGRRCPDALIRIRYDG